MPYASILSLRNQNLNTSQLKGMPLEMHSIAPSIAAEESEKRFDPLPARDLGHRPIKEKAW
jgi:hypothetical protein